ncbi:response regulator [Serratia odorifera]|uniref:Response regulator receiver domain protein n=1 Tax=Serratia odorifera DSM 4582 TaxID=667129 RepID=D4E505_SEROD|nr:response regulator [Serratia odorifera]EFE95201.1 response regulator receiver domain protein [Serratia odorifera DSM 4582]PNK89856.1 DNA-binding response regulator [Serratia odorifera]RII70561.1 DNA-binding response regulator [Serratia odorifera]
MQKTVVIADDHPVFLIGLRTVVTTSFGDDFVISGEAQTVDQLLALLAKKQPDVLLTDFNMPGDRQSDGLRLIETLRRKYPQLPIVVITMMTNPGLVKTILAAGARAVINKQSLTSELTTCLKALQQGRRPANVSAMPVTVAAMSPRELEVVRLLAQGHSVNHIAAMLSRTKQTISAQKKSAMLKIGVGSDAELFEYLREAGL